MNVVRINSKNVIFILLAIFSTTVKQAHMGYGKLKFSQAFKQIIFQDTHK